MNTPTNNNQPPVQAREGQFKRNIKGIGLTYSNIEQQIQRRTETGDQLTWVPTKSWLCQQILNLPGNDPHHIIVAEEKHKDGSTHFHCYVQWLAPHSNVDHRYFDIEGMHPNIQQIQDQGLWVGYIQKQDVNPFIWVPIIFMDDSDDEGIA